MTDHPRSLTAEDVATIRRAAASIFVASGGGHSGALRAALRDCQRVCDSHELQRRQVAALLKNIRALERPFSFNEGRRPDWERSWTCDWCNAGWADTPNVTHPVNDCLWVQAHAPDVLAEAARLGLGGEGTE